MFEKVKRFLLSTTNIFLKKSSTSGFNYFRRYFFMEAETLKIGLLHLLFIYAFMS